MPTGFSRRRLGNIGQRSRAIVASEALSSSLNRAKGRLWRIGLLATFATMLLLGVVVLLAAMWFDLVWELSPTARIAADVAAVVVAIAAAVVAIRALIRLAQDRAIASRLDQS